MTSWSGRRAKSSFCRAFFPSFSQQGTGYIAFSTIASNRAKLCFHQVLIFFQMTKVMDIMEDFLRMMGWKHLRLDGGTKTDERAMHVQHFNAKDSEIKV